MTSAKDIVREAGQRLKTHEIGQMPHIQKLWKEVRWSEVSTASSASAELSSQGINLYPQRLLADPKAVETVLREFGTLVFRGMSVADKKHWEKKHSLPTPEQIDAFSTRINSQEVQTHVRTYSELVDTFNTAVDRLVALNLANALLANGVKFSTSKGVDIKTYGATTDYASGRRYHSLVPLVSAYADRLVNASYGAAFADYIVNDLKSVRESSTAEALRHMVKSLAERSR